MTQVLDDVQEALRAKASALLALVPEAKRQAAGDLLAQWGPRFLQMSTQDAWQYLRRLLAGDIDAVAELDAQMSDDAFLAKVKANTARWENVANYNVVRQQMRDEFLLRLAPIVLSVLAALVCL
jgi:hypothetical protein